jgi:hypothetical protein
MSSGEKTDKQFSGVMNKNDREKYKLYLGILFNS